MTHSQMNHVSHRADVDVDELNQRFYSRYTYPWPARQFDRFADDTLGTRLLSHELGYYDSLRLPADAAIWVAGCGTNQAIFTALRFPRALVIGTDLSEVSLEVCATTAGQLGLTNLELRQESIVNSRYDASFDYVICTGVIHHTADPRRCLDRLAAAMRPDGLLELMVYNRFHRTATTSFQQGLRLLVPDAEGLEAQMEVVQQLAYDEHGAGGSVKALLHEFRGAPEAMIADTFLQPVERSYTVDGLVEMLKGAGLDLLLPCANQFDRAGGRLDWELCLPAGRARDVYEHLEDRRRWQVTNLLRAEASPMLWFYVGKDSSDTTRRNQQDAHDAFLAAQFTPIPAPAARHQWSRSGYREVAAPDVTRRPAEQTQKLIDDLRQCEGSVSMKALLEGRGIDTRSRATVARWRTQLATPSFPFIVSTQP